MLPVLLLALLFFVDHVTVPPGTRRVITRACHTDYEAYPSGDAVYNVPRVVNRVVVWDLRTITTPGGIRSGVWYTWYLVQCRMLHIAMPVYGKHEGRIVW